MGPRLVQLNDAQQRGATEPGNLLITACPGSGKTRVLAHRAKDLLTTAIEGNLAAVTFTNDAAAELKREILHLSPNSERRVYCGTFHNLCRVILDRAGLKRAIVNDYQAEGILRSLQARYFPDHTIEVIKASIERIKANIDGAMDVSEEPALEVHPHYQAELEKRQGHDFQDILVQCVLALRCGRAKPLNIKWMLVDEFQDTCSTQLAFVIEHLNAGVEVAAVGDDDQTIFGFRNAKGIAAFNDFLQASKGTHIALDQTYRCSPDIFKHAARLIARNVNRVSKHLRTANQQPGKVDLLRAVDRKHEAQLVAEAIGAVGDPEGCAVLARSNAILNEVEKTLLAVGVPYRRVGGVSIWDSVTAKTFLGAVAAIVKDDPYSVDDLLGSVGVSQTVRQQLRANLPDKRSGAARIQALVSKTPEEASPIEREVIEVCRTYFGDWQALAKDRANLVLYGLSDLLCDYGDKRAKKQAPQCAESLARIPGALQQRLMLVSAKRKSTAAAVQLMTLHASKGLEWSRVWIMGCEEGVLPHDDSEEEEERRLFYVGITRAKLQLTVSYTLDTGKPSSFLKEAGLLGSASSTVAAVS